MIYRFNEFALDAERRELRRGSQLRKLTRKSFDLLLYLLEHRARVVHKHELFAEIWRGEHVTPTVLPVTVRSIREALDEGGSGRVLRTVRGRGYRIVCRVDCDDVGSGSASPTTSSSSFVGRGALMASLRQDLERALQGEGQGALIVGEAGIGKTRVLDEVVRWAKAKSAIVLHTRCPDDAGAPPFWPIQQLLHAGASVLRSDRYQQAVESTAFDVERAEAHIASLFLRGPSRDSDPKVARSRLARTVVEWLVEASRVAPLVLVLDDLHWADEGTLYIYEAVARELPASAIFCVVAYRAGEGYHGRPWSDVVERLTQPSHLRGYALEGFDLDEIDAFMRRETGSAPDPGWTLDLLERTNGNPFFLRETLRLLVSEGRLQRGSSLTDVGLPQGVREAVERRLNALSPECVEVLAWASVMGRHFSLAVLERVVNLEGDQLLECLAEARAAHIVAQSAAQTARSAVDPGEHGFVHHLIRETIYEGMSAHERVLRHRGIGEAIEVLHGRSTARVFELARHFFEAAPAGDIDRAVNYCLRAARLARRRYAPEAEARHFEQALRVEELRLPRNDLRYCCLVTGWAVALWRAGRYAAAQAQYKRGAEQARALGRFDLLGQCALGLAGWPSFNRMRTGNSEPEMELEYLSALAQESLLHLGDSDKALRARLLSVQVRVGQQQTPPRVDPALPDRALAWARDSGDARAVFHALMSKIASLAGPARVHAALELASEAVTLAQRLAAPARTFAAHEVQVPLLLSVGDMTRVDAAIDAMTTIAAGMQVPAYSYSVSRFQIARLLGDGDLAGTRELLPRVRRLGEDAEDAGAALATRMIEFWMLAVEGRSEDARDTLAGASKSFRAPTGSAAALSAYFWMLADDRPRCAKHFERVAEDAFQTIRPGVSWLWHIGTCADVCAYLEDRERGEVLYGLIAPYRALNVTSSFYCYRGSAALPLARMALLLGRRKEATELFEQALEFNTRIGAVPSIAWTQLAYARMLAEGGQAQQRRARQLFQEADGGTRPLGFQLDKVGVAAARA